MKPETFVRADRPPVLLRAGIRLGPGRVYSGANRYHATTVIACPVDLGILAGVTTAQMLPEFRSAFLARFRSLPSFLPDNGISDAFVSELGSAEGVDLARLLLEAVVAVEHSISFSRHELGAIGFAAIERDADRPLLLWETSQAKISRRSAEIALAGVNELLDQRAKKTGAGDEDSFAVALEALREKVRRRRLAPSTAAVRLEAEKRGIPCQTLRRQHLLLGEGRLQHHFFASMTDSTSMAAQKICADKRQTNHRLRDLRLPVPAQGKTGTPEQAIELAKKIGFPLVVKPVRGKKGRAVSVGLERIDEIGAAFAQAHQSGADVLVEKFVPGLDYRLLVIGGRFVAAVHRKPPGITGDGRSTVDSLIDAENANPYRDGFRGFKIDKDDEVMRHLRMAGLALTDVPVEGREITLRTAANVSTGGLPFDVTDRVHPENRVMAERAALGVGLDVAGIDFISPDIGRPYHENGGAIVEVNARPGLDIHTWPVAGKSRNVAGALLEHVFPGGQKGRLPVALGCGDRGTGTIARALDRILRGAGRSVALTLREAYYADGRVATWPGRRALQDRSALLRDPGIGTLVSTVSLRQASESGLRLERASVSIVVDRAKAGRSDEFYQGVDIVARATTDSVVVGAGNRVVLEKLATDPGRRLILVANRANDATLRSHLRAGGVAAAIPWRDGENQVVLLSGEETLAGFSLERLIGQRGDGRHPRLQSACCYAVAGAHALGLTAAQIAASLSSAVEMVDA